MSGHPWTSIYLICIELELANSCHIYCNDDLVLRSSSIVAMRLSPCYRHLSSLHYVGGCLLAMASLSCSAGALA